MYASMGGKTRRDIMRIGEQSIDPKTLSVADYLRYLEEQGNGTFDLATVEQYLTGVLPAEGFLHADQVKKVLDALSRPDRLQQLVESILRSEEQLAQLAQNSFGHVTGMERIQLARVRGSTLRLHLWMPGSELLTEDPHNHTYNFGSKVLSGPLVTDLFTQSSEGISMDGFEIASQNSEEKPIPTPIGEAYLEPHSGPSGIILTNRNGAYTMPHTTIHRIRQVDPDAPIITLNLRGENVKETSTFFRDEANPTGDFRPVRVDTERRLGLLRDKLVA